MAKEVKETKKRKTAPVRSSEEYERKLIGMTYDLVEQKIREGDVPANVMIHFLKLGCSMNELEIERLKSGNRLNDARANRIFKEQRSEETFEKAWNAFREYTGDSAYDDDMSYE